MDKAEFMKIWWAQNNDPYAPYRDMGIAIEIETTAENLTFGLYLRKNRGTLLMNWGDGTEETLSVAEKTLVTHTYASAGKYIPHIADITGINHSYSNLNNQLYSPLVSRVVEWKLETSFFNYCRNAIIEELNETTTSFSLENCSNATVSVLPASVLNVGPDVFKNCTRITSVTFLGTPTYMEGRAFRQSSLTDIYVPWAEGEVANAPWGASSATIHYNHIP